MELHKNLTLDPTSNPASTHNTMTTTMSPTLTTPSPLAIPLSQLVKPTSLAALGLTSGVPTTSALFAADLNNISAAQSRKNLTTKIRTSASSHNGSKKTERNKFNPY